MKPESRVEQRWRYGLMLAVWLGLGMLLLHSVEWGGGKAAGVAVPNWRAAPPGTGPTQPPWGELEFIDLPLEFSDELLPQIERLLTDPKWFFPDYSLERTTNLLRACEFTDADLTRTMKEVEWKAVWHGKPGLGRIAAIALSDLDPKGVMVVPPAEVVLKLSAPARQRIYSVLSTSPENPYHWVPFRFAAADFESLLVRSRLPGEKIEAIRRLVYKKADSICFADVPLLRHILTSEEMKRILRILYHAPTFVLQLRFHPNMDMDRLVRYWGQCGRAQAIGPFLVGAAKACGPAGLSVTSLLPGFAATRLYTFPDPTRDPAKFQKQGLWTALNFFKEQPDDRYLEDDYALQALKAGFAVTGRAPSYGDLIALTSPSGEVVHASAYIADQVVFTRNGADALQPWVLMSIPELMARFGANEPVRLVVYGRKPT